MKKVIVSLLAVAFYMVAAFVPAVADEPEEIFYGAAAKYFALKEKDVADIMKTGINVKDLPVVLFIAQKTQSSPKKIAETRAQGDTWVSILKARIIQPKDFYMLIGSKINSSVYAPIFEKFKGAEKFDWASVDLTDSDIINLVNLKFISSHYDYSIFEVMAMRDKGKDFVKILNAVKVEKDKMIAEEKRKKKEAAKAKKAQEAEATE